MTAAAEPIAIVGIACEYPDAPSPERLWENVLAGRRAFRRVPAERLRLEDYEDVYSTEAAVLEGYAFDRVAFRVSGPSFRAADLTHWLALDVAHRALADAGFPGGDRLPHDSTAVILGNTLTGEFSRAGLMRLRWPYVRRVVEAALRDERLEDGRRSALLERIERDYKRPFEPFGDETLAGGLSNTIGGRICNHLDLHGGGYTVDGACAASLLAVVTACSQLASGSVDVALAGGVDLSLDPFELVGFAKVGALAAEDMRVYDARSAGFWPGEGCGMVVLMRLADALADGRRVHAIVRGHGVSSDGAGGLTRPERDGQLLALRRAYRRAGVDASTVALFEGHGTGTAVGDATELRVLAAARGAGGVPTAIGSIKANIGHTKAAAGVAGLLKATLAVRERLIPPTTGAERLHPELERAAGALRVARDVEPWPEGMPVRAGVSAMGFGGINTHVVLDGPDHPVSRRRPTLRERQLAASAQDAELFVFAGDSPAALVADLERLRPAAPRLSRAELGDVAAELGRRRLEGGFRVAVVASSATQLADRLESALVQLSGATPSALDSPQGVFVGHPTRVPRIALLLPGQGSPSHVDGGLLRRRFPAVVERLYASAALPPRGADTVATEIAQPAIVTASLAALRVLAELRIEGAVAVGHSLGELTALAWARVYDEAAAQRIAAARGRAMAALRSGDGAMVSLPLAAGDAERLAAGLPVVIAGLNAPARTVMAGPAEAIDALATRARGRGTDATRLRVSHAFHSPLVAAAADELARMLADEVLVEPRKRVVSTVTGQLIEPGDDIADLLRRQVTAPVRFAEAIEAAAAGADLLIEAGPGRVLSALAGESVPVPAIALDAGGPSLAGILSAAAAAWILGAPVRIDALFEGRFTRPFDLCREPSFLANPCERAPLPQDTGAPPADAGMSREEREPAAVALKEPEADPADVVRRLVAERAEMPADAVAPASRMLDDLHLTSIVVGEIAVEAAKRLGLAPPAAPTELANATIAQLAEALTDPRRTSPATAFAEPPGVGPWVRPFALEWVERALPRTIPREAAPGRWRVLARPGHPLAEPLAEALARAGGEGVALCAPPMATFDVPLLLQAAQAALDSQRLLVVQGTDCHVGGLARSVHLEAPDCAVAVVTLPFDVAAAGRAAEEALATHGFTESRYTEDGRRLEPVLRHLSSRGGDRLPVGPADVVLVTGGARGIAAECMLAIARASGAALAILGRSHSSDDEVAANLERMAAAGVRVRYARADVTDAAAVRAAIEALGPVTAVVHAAGANEPRRLAEADVDLFARTLRPKVRGLENVLAAVDPGTLRMLVTFGSIIARMGMRGDAHYALANEWQSGLTERFAAEHPECVCLAFESSVWSAVGMGERLGSVDALARQGVHAIPPESGAALLEALLRMRERPPAVIATGRFGRPPTLRLAPAELPLLRFIERPLVHYAEVELVADAELEDTVDPYLGDHVLDGDQLMPAVIGLEAMAQAIAALTGSADTPTFTNLRLARPLIIPPGARSVVRVAVLADGPKTGSVVLRGERTDFAVDHFSARWRLGAEPGPPHSDLPIELPTDATAALEPDALYGGLLFQSGRFRRLRGYRRLTATQCVAELEPAAPVGWFGRYLPQDLLLGDPGVRDAALHALQACVPHARVVPIAVDSLWPGVTDAPGPWRVHAREREHRDDEFVFDLVITGAGGNVRERWDGIRLRVVAPVATTGQPWPTGLLIPFVERHLTAGVHVALTRSGPTATRRERSQHALRDALGMHPRLRHRPDGRPEINSARETVSTAHADGLTLAVAGPGPLACDLELVASRPWPQLLGPERAALSATLARELGEHPDAAATRVWAAGECLVKAGVPVGAPLALAGGGSDGWLVLASAAHAVATYVARVRGNDEPLALAVLTGSDDARV